MDKKRNESWTNTKRTERLNPEFLQFNLIVKRSVGPLFDGSLLLLIPDLDHHAGVDVLPHQLPGFCDVDGNL